MAVVKIIEIPDMNPIRFVKDGHPYAAYQTLNSRWFKDQEQYWNAGTNFYQPFETLDYVGIQIKLAGIYINAETSIRLQVIDCKGAVLAEIAPTTTLTVPGDVYRYNNTDYNFKTYNWATSFAGRADGVYFLRIALPYQSGLSLLYDYYVSEPILVLDKHFGTNIMEYLSYTNKYNVNYQGGMFFHLRVPGEIVYYNPKNNAVSYDDQLMNPRQQSATPYREIWHKMGYPGGLPMWMYDKVNRAYNNDYVLTDKVRYVREGEIEIGSRMPRYNKYGGVMKLREYDAVAQTINAGASGLVLFNAYSGTSYALFRGRMKNTGTGYAVTFYAGYEVTSQAQENDLLNIFNTYSKGVTGLTGNFLRHSNGTIVYENGPGEAFDTSECIVFTKFFAFNYNKAGSTTISPNIYLQTTRVSVVFKHNYEVYNHGDGSTDNYALVHPTYTYASTDTSAAVKVYHDDKVRQIICNEQGTGMAMNSITGAIPTALLELNLNGCQLPGTLNMAPYPITLRRLIVTRCSFFFTGLSNFNRSWVDMHWINLSHNLLDSSMVDSMFNQHYNGNAYNQPLNGSFLIYNQTPAAAPTAASATARNKLLTRNWTINTD